MKIPIEIRLERRVRTALGLNDADAAAFKELCPSGHLEYIEPVFDRSLVSNKQLKEVEAFCALAGNTQFSPIIEHLLGVPPSDVLLIEVLTDGDDPPDLVLTVNRQAVRIEVSDYPPDQELLKIALRETNGETSSLPTYAEGGHKLAKIRAFVGTPPNLVEPHFASLTEEIGALARYGADIVAKKDRMKSSDILLLHGPIAFEFPTVEALARVVEQHEFVSVRFVVFVQGTKVHVFPTCLA